MRVVITNLISCDRIPLELTMLSTAWQFGRSNLSTITLFIPMFLAPVLSFPAVAGTLEDLIKSGALPGSPQKPMTTVMVDNIKQNGRVTTVFYSSRQPKTRAAIHMHDDAGVTCIVQGEMTLYLQGLSPIKKTAGECYYMPSGTQMVAFNSGDKIAVFYDFFNFADGGSPLTVVEGGGCDSRQDDSSQICSDNPYIKHH